MDLFGFCSPSKTGPDCCPTSNGAAVRSFQSQDPRRPVGLKTSPGPRGSADARGDGRKESRAGIGIIVALNPDSSLYVHTVCAGATAEGLLHAGDVLLEVDGQDVFRAPAPHVADLLLGPVLVAYTPLLFPLNRARILHHPASVSADLAAWWSGGRREQRWGCACGEARTATTNISISL